MTAAAHQPWRTDAAAVPLRSWSDAQMLAYGKCLQAPAERCAATWGLPLMGHPAVTCAAATVADATAWAWQAVGRGAAVAAWVAQADDVPSWIAQALFEADAVESPVLAAVCEACARDLRSHLAAALQLDADRSAPSPTRDQLGAWSGAVIATLPPRVLLLASGPAVAACVARSPVGGSPPARAASAAPLTRIDEALSNRLISLQATLQSCELDVATLQRLQPGDVVRLPHALDLPLGIETREGHTAFSGALVRAHGAKAVALVSAGSLR